MLLNRFMRPALQFFFSLFKFLSFYPVFLLSHFYELPLLLGAVSLIANMEQASPHTAT